MSSIQISSIGSSVIRDRRGALEDFKRFTKNLEKNVIDVKLRCDKAAGRTGKKGLKS